MTKWTVRNNVYKETYKGQGIYYFFGQGYGDETNGQVRRWKREPERFELPLKYGMYEYGTFTNRDLDRLVTVV